MIFVELFLFCTLVTFIYTLENTLYLRYIAMDYTSLFMGLSIGFVFSGIIIVLIWRNLRLSSAKENHKLAHNFELLEQQHRNEIIELENQHHILKNQLLTAEQSISHLERELTLERDRAKNLKIEFEKMQQSAKLEFEKVASDILERKSQNFIELNEQRVGGMLKPLGATIESFKRRIEDTFTEQTKQRTSLEAQVKELVETTTKIGTEANNLASALKGDNKRMGNWGEMILESILENSGLIRGEQYEVQATLQGEDGRILRPDIIVNLPEQRAIIIDSKVSLVAYDRYSNASSEAELKLALSEHLRSIRSHVESLAKKQYDNHESSLDFVMMFIPIEPAYLLAIKQDEELWSFAYNQRVLLISPTNLIACLKLISDLWKREMQSKNAMDIVKRAELMYEKFVGFVSNMEALGSSIEKTQKSYQSALSQLSSGRGNLISQATTLHNLGLKSSKRINKELLGDIEQLDN